MPVEADRADGARSYRLQFDRLRDAVVIRVAPEQERCPDRIGVIDRTAAVVVELRERDEAVRRGRAGAKRRRRSEELRAGFDRSAVVAVEREKGLVAVGGGPADQDRPAAGGDVEGDGP